MRRMRWAHLVVLLPALYLLTIPSATHAGWPPLFRGAEQYDAGSWTTSSAYRGGTPGGVAVGDLNGDALPDLVATTQWDENGLPGNTVAVLLHTRNTGSPTLFLPKVNYSTGQGPMGVVVADLNLDGKLDVVTAERDSISVLLGNGLGGLTPPVSYLIAPVAYVDYSVVVADVNNDGRPDVIAGTNTTTRGISVLLGTGSGTLGPPSFYPLGSPGSVYALAAGDVTGDGVVDMVASVPGGVAIFRGDNTGAFSNAGSIPTANGHGTDLAIGRVNGDMIPDIVVVDNAIFTGGGVSVLIGLAGGGYQLNHYGFGGWISQVRLAELDVSGDGIDIVGSINAESESRHCVVVLRGNGSGGFGTPTYYPAMAAFGHIELADLDLNGVPDVVASQVSGSEVTTRVHSVGVLLGNGVGGFQSTTWSLEGRKPARATIADYNLDGKNDMAFSDSSSIGMALGNGDGTFNYMLGLNTPLGPGMIVSGEWNGDARPDIGYQIGSSVVGRYGVGTGGFSFVQAFSFANHVLFSRSVGDMNRDGRQDLVLQSYSPPFVLRIYTQAVDGTFFANTPQSLSAFASSIALGDWNRDGILDVMAATDNGVSFFRGVGSGSLQAEQVLTSGRSYSDVCSGDFNRDGRLDVAAIERTAGQSGTRGITTVLGDGVGGFGPPTTIPTLEQNGALLESWDVNLDGKPDLISSGYADQDEAQTFLARPGVVEVHLGDGAGGFSSRTAHALGSQTAGFTAGDVNRDDRRDIVTTGIAVDLMGGGPETSFQTLIGTPPNQGYWLAPRTDYAMSASTNRVAVGDLNRDGLLDVVSSSPTNLVTVRFGTVLGILGPPTTVGTSLSARQVGLGDFNRDGILDLVISRTGLGAPEGVSCMFGVGDGTFGPRLDHAIASAAEFEIADMNRDGFPDIVVGQANISGSAITILTWNGSGSFAEMPSAYVGYVYDLEVVDFDRDGDLDVVVAGGALYILYGNGDGTLDNSLIRNVGSTNLQSVCVADFDRDGYPDAALADVSATVRVAWGSSNFTTYIVSSTPASALDLEVGSAQADGRPFLYMTTYTNTVTLLQPTGALGQFTAAVAQDVGGNPDALALGDFDRDGQLDVVATNSNSGAVALFLHAESPVTGVHVAADTPSAPARLGQNFPNPFNPTTTIQYELKRSDRVRLAVFDVQGRLVKTLVDGVVAGGEHEVRWEGRRNGGSAVASGVYFYRLTTDSGYVESRRMVLMR